MDANNSSDGSDYPELETESDESSSTSADEVQQQEDPLLYEGSQVTLSESLHAIMTFSIVHKLSGACLADLLKLIMLHCPANSRCIRSLHIFKNHFAQFGAEFKLHYYCTSCVYPLTTKDSVCDVCRKQGKPSYFIEVPIDKQLGKLYNRDGFYEKLQFRFNRQKKNVLNLEDIYDGDLYQELFQEGEFLHNNNNISMTLYTDGVSVYSTSRVELWPLCFHINELPYKDRLLKENILLAGIWVSSNKPDPNVFLRPFVASLKKFKEVGFELNVSGAGPKLIKGIVIAGTCDLPAKAKFMRMNAHSGYFSCSRCEIPGERFPVGRTTIHVFPYSENLVPRCHENMKIYADQAKVLRRRNPDSTVKGVKGNSLLYNILYDFIRSMGIDIMHGCFLGVAKLMVSLWFDTAYADQPFSMCHLLELVDARLNKISPPSSVQRMPKCIAKQLGYWKALEYKMFLIFYSVPVLNGLMERRYFHHLCKLVSALYLLNQDSISPNQIHEAHELLKDYVKDFETLYGLRWLTLNVHQLLHLPEAVRDLGPLWVYSCFPWEDLIGKLAQLVHGTRYPGLQIAKSCPYVLNLPTLVRGIQNEVVTSYCEKIMFGRRSLKVAEVIDNSADVIGTYKVFQNVPQFLIALLQDSLEIIGGKIKFFYRLRKRGILYCGQSYVRSTQKNSSFVCFSDGNYLKLCALDYFLRWSRCNDNCNFNCRNCEAQFVCVGTEHERVQWIAHELEDVQLSYMSKVKKTQNRVAFLVSALESLCHYVSVDDEEYIIRNVNRLEIE